MSIEIYSPSAEELGARSAVRTLLQPLAPFPSPRILTGPWGLTRLPRPAQAIRPAPAPVMRARAQDGQIAALNYSINLSLAVGERRHDSRTLTIPAPARLTSLNISYYWARYYRGRIWVSIPTHGYHVSQNVANPLNEPFQSAAALNIDISTPAMLEIGYDLWLTNVQVDLGFLELYANLAYQPTG